MYVMDDVIFSNYLWSLRRWSKDEAAPVPQGLKRGIKPLKNQCGQRLVTLVSDPMKTYCAQYGITP
jgi:hypothetical protein